MTRKAIPYGKHSITDEDIAAVVDVLRSDFLTQGVVINEFENQFSEYIGSEYAVAVSNGTAALHLSYLAIGLGPGQKILTTPITFSASANAALYTGAEVVFADIEESTFLIDLNKVESVLKKDTKKEIKGITLVDLGGLPCQLNEFRFLANKYDLFILEDACHAPGGSYKTSEGISKCGDGTHSDLAIFSFHPVKHIAAGEGGMVTTNRKDLFEKISYLRTHGITKDPSLMSENHGPWYYEMIDLGYNYRLTDIQSALGLSQLKKAENGLEKRKEIAQKYYDALVGLPLKFQETPEGRNHAYHLFVITTDDRDSLFTHLKNQNIHPQVHYIPIHILPYYRKFGWKKGDFPVAESYYSKCISLPMYPSLTEEEQEFIIEQVRKFYKK